MKLRVKEICKDKGILFKDLAEKIGVSDVGLRKQVQGNPTIDTLQKIADALEVPLTDLFTQTPQNSFSCPYCGRSIKVDTECQQTEKDA